MDWAGKISAAEWAVDVAAAAIFAAAVGFAGSALATGASGAMAAAAFLLACAGLRHVPVEERTFDLPEWPLCSIEPVPEAHDELVLDDRLMSVDPDARVVRLFDVSNFRGAAGSPVSAPPDAAQALSDALAELRRSMR